MHGKNQRRAINVLVVCAVAWIVLAGTVAAENRGVLKETDYDIDMPVPMP